jgi:hypothetical protein
MTFTIAETLKNKILPLGFCERFGGIAVPFEIYTANNKLVRVPVTFGVDGQACYESGKLFDLSPNDAYRSVMFFEDQTGSTVVTQGKTHFSFSGTFRLLGWLNLAKLGHEEGGYFTDLVVGTIVKTLLSGDRSTVLTIDDFGGTLEGAVVQVETVSIPRKDRSLFSRYTAAEWQQAFVYPFDFFAIDIQARITVGRNCFTEADATDPITCITIY